MSGLAVAFIYQIIEIKRWLNTDDDNDNPAAPTHGKWKKFNKIREMDLTEN